MKTSLAVILVVLALSGCDSRECLESHDEMMMMPMSQPNGQFIYIPQWYEVCDKYAPEVHHE